MYRKYTQLNSRPPQKKLKIAKKSILVLSPSFIDMAWETMWSNPIAPNVHDKKSSVEMFHSNSQEVATVFSSPPKLQYRTRFPLNARHLSNVRYKNKVFETIACRKPGKGGRGSHRIANRRGVTSEGFPRNRGGFRKIGEVL